MAEKLKRNKELFRGSGDSLHNRKGASKLKELTPQRKKRKIGRIEEITLYRILTLTFIEINN